MGKIMKREVRLSEKLLIVSYSLILLFMILQDWVSLGSLNDVTAIAQVHSFNELLTVTIINVFQIVLLMTLIVLFVGKRYPF
jgi:hypothetical protein